LRPSHSRLRVAPAVERECLLHGAARVEEFQREVDEAQSESRAVRQQMGEEALEVIVPAEVGVAVVRPRRDMGARHAREPLGRVMRLQARRRELRVEAADRGP